MTKLVAMAASAALVTLASASFAADTMPSSGTTPYVTHFVFRPVTSLEVPSLGTATLLEAVGTATNMKGEKMLDKMSAHCMALNVASAIRNTSTALACWPMQTAIRYSRPSIRVTSTNRSRI